MSDDLFLIANRDGKPVGGFPVNGHDSMEGLTANERSILMSRWMLSKHGSQFGGDRDYYEVLGYPKELTINDYRAKFERDGLAATVVEFPAEETWRDTPQILDGRDKDATEDTEFVRAWQAFAERLRVYHYCERVDTLSGLGRFGVILIGVAGGGELTQPVVSLSGTDQIMYLRPYSEEFVSIKEFETDPNNPRFGLPRIYTVKIPNLRDDSTSAVGAHTNQFDVHWSRVIHVAEGLLENEVYGRPRLQRVYNLLDDILKVVGGSAEATWKLMRKGFVLDIDPDAKMEPSDVSDLEEQFDEYDHGLRRFLRTRGMRPHDLGSQTADPSPVFNAIVSLLSAATRIPQRILLGSERGELASSQDASNWAGHIAGRQEKFAAPMILRPLIDRLMGWGAIPMPASGQYSIQWQPLFEQTDREKADTAHVWADALWRSSQALGQSPITMGEYRREFTPLPEDMPEGEETPILADLTRPVVNQMADIAQHHGYNEAESRAIVVAAARVLSRQEAA